MDYTLGIYQSIGEERMLTCFLTTHFHSRRLSGYKEFRDYLSASEPSETAFRLAVEQTKLGTRRYAKRQVAWIRNKLLPVANSANTESQAECGEPIVPTDLLDATGMHHLSHPCQRDSRVPVSSAWGGMEDQCA